MILGRSNCGISYRILRAVVMRARGEWATRPGDRETGAAGDKNRLVSFVTTA